MATGTGLDKSLGRALEDSSTGGTQSIERAVALLLLVGRAEGSGARLSDLVAQSGLSKPTARRVLLALVRLGLIDQDQVSRRYQLGPQAYVLGTLAGARFGIHALSLPGLSRIAKQSGDSAFLSVRREAFAICLHREEGAFPIRTHVLLAGDRHPLGIGAGSLAMLAGEADEEVERILEANGEVLQAQYPMFDAALLRANVAQTRAEGYALNPGLYVAGSWGIGVVVKGPDGQVAGALSIAAIESRLTAERRAELVPLLKREAIVLEAALKEAALGRPALSASRPPAARAPTVRTSAKAGR